MHTHAQVRPYTAETQHCMDKAAIMYRNMCEQLCALKTDTKNVQRYHYVLVRVYILHWHLNRDLYGYGEDRGWRRRLHVYVKGGRDVVSDKINVLSPCVRLGLI